MTTFQVVAVVVAVEVVAYTSHNNINNMSHQSNNHNINHKHNNNNKDNRLQLANCKAYLLQVQAVARTYLELARGDGRHELDQERAV
jgi:hypothetical protein